MTYHMRLATEYFDKITAGTKTIECRLYNEKRKRLNIGDIIEFSDAQNVEKKVTASIVALHHAASFSELLDRFPISAFGGESKEPFLSALKKFYSTEDEKKFGVVGIEIKLV